MKAGIRIITFALMVSPAVAVAELCDSDQVCGPRCVQHILESYEIQADLVNLIAEIQQSDVSRGSTLVELRNALRERGISCDLIQLGIFEIPKAIQPVILHVNNDHFVVLEGWDGYQAIVWDGLCGMRKIPWWKLRMSCSSGAALVTFDKAFVHATHTHDYRPAVLTISAFLIMIGGCILTRYLLRRFHFGRPVVENQS